MLWLDAIGPTHGCRVSFREFEPADLDRADRIWWSLATRRLAGGVSQSSENRRKEGGSCHPELNLNIGPHRSRPACRSAAQDTVRSLASSIGEYEEKFGFIFIVCATGKSSEEMLAILRERLRTMRKRNCAMAAREQARIAKLRLRETDRPMSTISTHILDTSQRRAREWSCCLS